MSQQLKNIGENIRLRASLADLEAKDLSALTDLPISSIYDYMSGKTMPSPDRLATLARVLYCTVADLVNPPIAQDRPNWPQAWQVMTQFIGSLTPAKRRLLDVASTLDDRETLQWAAKIDAFAKAKAAASQASTQSGDDSSDTGKTKA